MPSIKVFGCGFGFHGATAADANRTTCCVWRNPETARIVLHRFVVLLVTIRERLTALSPQISLESGAGSSL